MSVNKVQLANGETIIDISDSTVTPETLAEGVTAHDASGRKITGKMIPGGGRSVQSDWNQYDETSADFIKNKPFGDVPTVLYEGTDIAPMESDGAYMLSLPIFEVIENQSYSVVIDGVKYETKGGLVYGAIPFIGNPALVEAGEDDGSPYVCMVNVDTQEHMMFAMVAPFTSIRITTNTIQKMEQKYLPFGEIVLGYDYYKGGNTKYLYNGNTEASNVVTLSDLKGFYRTGRTVYVRYGFDRYLPIMAHIEGFDNYGFLAIIKEDGSLLRFYTAEYTPET